MGNFVETKVSCMDQGVIAHMKPTQKMYYFEGKHSIPIYFLYCLIPLKVGHLMTPPTPKRSPTLFLSAFPKKKTAYDHQGALNK